MNEQVSKTYPAPTVPGVYLRLWHGRPTLEEDMDDWGTDGPYIGPLQYAHTTYANDIKLEYAGPGRPADMPLDLPIVEDCVFFEGVYYGDWSVFVVGQLPITVGNMNAQDHEKLRTKTTSRPVYVWPGPDKALHFVSTVGVSALVHSAHAYLDRAEKLLDQALELGGRPGPFRDRLAGIAEAQRTFVAAETYAHEVIKLADSGQLGSGLCQALKNRVGS